MAKLDLRHHRPDLETLPDGRQRATFVYRVREWVGRTRAEINAECALAWGTPAPGDFSALRLIKQDLKGLEPAEDGSLTLVRVFEELSATGETQVGENAVQKLEDGRTAIVAEFLQFSAAEATPGTVGTTTAPGDNSAYLLTEEAPDDGTLRRIKRTYVYAGTLSQSDETRNNGALLLRTIASVKTEPSTPSGYTRVRQAVKSPNGVPVYTYQFAKGTGTISQNDETRNNGALLLRTIVALGTAPGTPSGYTTVSTSTREEEGYTLYSYQFAKGTGVIETTTDKREGALVITTTTTIVAAAGSDPAEPSHLLSRTKREADGHKLFTDRYISAGAGVTTSTTTRTRADGSTEITVENFDTTDDPPASTGGGYLVAKRTSPQPGGYYQNQATYIVLPSDVTLSKQVNFTMPGRAYFSGTQLILEPPTTRTVLASVAISYGTSQDTTTPFSVDRYASFYESYKRTDDGAVVTSQRGLGGYLGDDGVIGTNGSYNGVDCDTYAASVGASSPTTQPSGDTVLSVDNDIYLVALDGTVVFRSEVVTASL